MGIRQWLRGLLCPAPSAPPWITAPAPGGPCQHITFINHSTQVTPAQFQACVAVLQVQVDRDFAPVWGVYATVDALPGGWPISILDASDVPGALGYHDVDPTGTPFGRVFVETSQLQSVSWQSVASHELLELLADPFVFGAAPGPGGTFWALEVGDPVEDVRYTINGIEVSDFATPAWFSGIPSAGPFDAQHAVQAAHQITFGGYASVFQNGAWAQIPGGRLNVDAAYQRHRP